MLFRSKLEKATALWQALGCLVTPMSADAHDAAFAAVSHLPHMLAFAIINGIASQKDSCSDFLSLAGPGFRDFSRIAASNPQIWRDVLIANREELLAQLHHFRHALSKLEHAITNSQGDELERLINQASHLRASWRINAPTK